MKKLIALVLLLNFTVGASFAAEILRTVEGSVTLLSKKKKLDEDLLEIYQGSEAKVQKARKITVSGDYAGNNSVTVEDSEAADGEERNVFVFPVTSIMNRFETNAKSTIKFGSVNLLFVADEVDDNGGENPPVDSVGSVTNVVSKKAQKAAKKKARKRFQKLLQTANSDATMSVKKIVGTREGDEAILKGTFFRKGSPAKGRFKLKFTP